MVIGHDHDHLECASPPKTPIRQRLGKDPDIQESEKIPLRAPLGFEVPEDPALAVQLKHIQLHLDILAHVVLESLCPGLDEVDVLAGAVECGAGVGAIVAGADSIAVEGGGAVRRCCCPLTYHEPLVTVLGVGGDIFADKLSVLGWLHGGEVVVEDLVLVVVH